MKEGAQVMSLEWKRSVRMSEACPGDISRSHGSCNAGDDGFQSAKARSGAWNGRCLK